MVNLKNITSKGGASIDKLCTPSDWEACKLHLSTLKKEVRYRKRKAWHNCSGESTSSAARLKVVTL